MAIGIDDGLVKSFDETFPQIGVDQPSEQFRDNWVVIKTATENLQSKTIAVTGDVSGISAQFDSGAGAVALTLNLPDVVAGGVFPLASLIVDNKGRITTIADVSGDFIKTDGTNAMVGNLNMNGNDIVMSGGVVDTRNVSADGAVLDSLNNGTGFKVQTAPGVFVNRELLGVSNEIEISNGFGLVNPIIGLFDNAVLPGTGAVTVPKGTTGQEPGAGAGQLRFNTQTTTLDYNDGTLWRTIVNTASGSGTFVDVGGDTMTGDLIMQNADIQISTGRSILDGRGDVILTFVQTPTEAGGVNEIWIRNGAVGEAPELLVRGLDTNIDLLIDPKGTGKILLGGDLQFTATVGGSVCDNDGDPILVLTKTPIEESQNHVEIVSADFLVGPTIKAEGTASDIDLNIDPKNAGNLILDGLVWPNLDGASGEVISTDGAGNLIFIPAPGTGTVTSIASGLGLFDGGAPITTSGTLILDFNTLPTSPAPTSTDLIVHAASGAPGGVPHIASAVSTLGTPLSIGGGGILMAALSDDTTPTLTGSLELGASSRTFVDANGNEMVTWVEETGEAAVNHIEIENAPTGFGPEIRAVGDDAAVDLNLTPKGVGALVLDGLNWPTSDGINGQLLKTDGAGNLSFATVGGSGTVTQIDTGPGLDGGPITITGTIQLDLSTLALATNPPAESDLFITDAAPGTPPNFARPLSDLKIANGGFLMSNLVDDTSAQLGSMLDVNGNSIGDGTRVLIAFVENGAAVNHIEVENNAAFGGPIIRAVGSDTNIDLNLSAKGTGSVILGSGSVKMNAPLNMNGQDLVDSIGNELISFVQTVDEAGASNHIQITNAATGASPAIDAVGDSTNIDLLLGAKGTGAVIVSSSTEVDTLRFTDHGSNAQIWELEEDSGSPTNHLVFDYNSIERFRITQTGDLRFTGDIQDVNGDEFVTFASAGSAVNHITISNANTGGGPAITATGDDTNIDLIISAKGTGSVLLGSNSVVLNAPLDMNGKSIVGPGGTVLLSFVEDESGVNWLDIENESTGSGPILRAKGTDTNVDLVLEAKGDGFIVASSTVEMPAGMVVGGGTPILGMFGGSIIYDFPSIAAGGTLDTPTISVPDAVTPGVPHSVSIGLPSAPDAGLIFNAFVSGTGTVVIRATNITPAPIDPASATYYVTVTLF